MLILFTLELLAEVVWNYKGMLCIVPCGGHRFRHQFRLRAQDRKGSLGGGGPEPGALRVDPCACDELAKYATTRILFRKVHICSWRLQIDIKH